MGKFMATSKDFMEYLLENSLGDENVSCRPMMGEYLVYYGDKVVADVCDNKLFVKPVKAAVDMLPDAPLLPPYAGAKPFALVEEIDDGEFLLKLFKAVYDELPAPKPKKRKKSAL